MLTERPDHVLQLPAGFGAISRLLRWPDAGLWPAFKARWNRKHERIAIRGACVLDSSVPLPREARSGQAATRSRRIFFSASLAISARDDAACPQSRKRQRAITPTIPVPSSGGRPYNSLIRMLR